MPNKQITDGNYRYAFQGQEKDPETGMEAFELRLWDGRLGRWLSVDPYHEFDSPYLGMGNNPINGIDPDGGKFYPTFGEIKSLCRGLWTGTKSFAKSIYYHGDTIDSVASLVELSVATSGIFGGSTYLSPYTNALIYHTQYTKTNTAGLYLVIGSSLNNYIGRLSSENEDISNETLGEAIPSLFTLKGFGSVGKASVIVEVGLSGEVLALQGAESQLLLGQGVTRVITKYNIQFAVSQGLEMGQFNFDKIRSMIPNGTPNTFNPLYGSEKYTFTINGTNVQLKWHTPEFAGMHQLEVMLIYLIQLKLK